MPFAHFSLIPAPSLLLCGSRPRSACS